MFSQILLLLAAYQSSPLETVKKVVAEFNARDFVGIADMCLGGKKAAAKTYLGSLPQTEVVAVEMQDAGVVTVTGDAADVMFPWTSVDNPSAINTRIETVHLKWVDGKWLIVPSAKASLDGGLRGGLAAFLNQPDAKSPVLEYLQDLFCLAQVEELGLAFLLYAGDHDDNYMPANSDLHKVLAYHLKSQNVWLCPLTNKLAYSVNAHL